MFEPLKRLQSLDVFQGLCTQVQLGDRCRAGEPRQIFQGIQSAQRDHFDLGIQWRQALQRGQGCAVADDPVLLAQVLITCGHERARQASEGFQLCQATERDFRQRLAVG